MKKYRKSYDVLRKYQERFVAKLLSYSLRYGNVLYCMNNETSTSPQWGRHWMKFVQTAAAKEDVVAHGAVCTGNLPLHLSDVGHYLRVLP